MVEHTNTAPGAAGSMVEREQIFTDSVAQCEQSVKKYDGTFGFGGDRNG